MKIKNIATPHIDETIGHDRFDDVRLTYCPDEVTDIQIKEQEITLFSKKGFQVKIYIITPQIIRFRYAPQGRWEHDFSYSLTNFETPKVAFQTQKISDIFEVKTNFLYIKINLQNVQVGIYNLENQIISLDDEEEPYVCQSTLAKGITSVKIKKKSPKSEQFFGLGDKAAVLNLRGKRYENYCTDAFAFDEVSNAMYRAIPFFIAAHETASYGIFMDNPYRSHFDFDSRKKGLMTFEAEGGEMNYYFLGGKDPIEVLKNYHFLTGLPELPPLWALGFHQCRWSYYPEKRVQEVAQTFRDLQIPCDAIYLDIDYMNGYRCFTWNDDYFPNPQKMIADLQKKGFHTVVMIDPGIKADNDYSVFQEGLEKGYFLKRPDGDLLIGWVWAGETVFPDYTDPEARKWWGNLYEKLYLKDGVSGFWNDMNEPANFKLNSKTIPDDTRHYYESIGSSHRKAHNVYGMLMARASQEGLKRLNPEKRPFLLTRASFGGGQRYAAIWTGDNVASWEHLRIANRQMQALALSGFSFTGSDIGGFVGMPDGELMLRWLQLAVFHPLMRIHSMGNNAAGDAQNDEENVKNAEKNNRLDQEPWAFGEKWTDLNRKAIELRYELLPYLYTAFYQHTTVGKPIIQPTFITENSFIFGEHLLVSPILKKGQKTQTIQLPEGVWLDFWDGKRYTEKATIKIKDWTYLPIFVRAGAVVPMYPVQQYTNEKPIEVLILKVYWNEKEGKKVTSLLYEDEGEGYGYKENKYLLTTFNTCYQDGVFQIERHSEGNFVPTYSTIQLQIFQATKRHTVDIPFNYHDKKQVFFSLLINDISTV